MLVARLPNDLKRRSLLQNVAILALSQTYLMEVVGDSQGVDLPSIWQYIP